MRKVGRWGRWPAWPGRGWQGQSGETPAPTGFIFILKARELWRFQAGVRQSDLYARKNKNTLEDRGAETTVRDTGGPLAPPHPTPGTGDFSRKPSQTTGLVAPSVLQACA